MKKLLIIVMLLFSFMLIVGAPQSFAYSTLEEGCLTCHTTFAGGGGTGHSTHKDASVGCTSCHVTAGSTPIASSKCIVCHPRGNPGQCNLANIAVHPKSGDNSCIKCHCAATTTTTIPSGAFCTDNDKDTFGDNCTAGLDCDDTNPAIHENCGCIDNDNDTYGDNCTAGPDCDDNDPAIHDGCEIDCTLTIRPKTFTVLRAVLLPLQFFIIRADRDSSISFSNPLCIFWSSQGIDDRVKIRIGEKLIIGYIQVYPTHLTAGDFKVYVTFGDISETQCGSIEIK